MSAAVSAYIPCFNNEATLPAAIQSVQGQTVAPAEIIVIDDGSTDDSSRVAEKCGAKVIRQGRNLGRGAARARAINEARNDLVLGCDATVVLPDRFVELALPYFKSDKVAAVCGHFVERRNDTVARRWQARHLYKQDQPQQLTRRASLFTAGSLLRRAHILKAGNFNALLRHSEDSELGTRLLQAGYEVVNDPNLELECLQTTSLARLLERYWRWYAGSNEQVSLSGYARLVWYSVRVMARRDLRQGDAASALVSLLMPHNQFWRSVARSWTAPKRAPVAAAPTIAGTT